MLTFGFNKMTVALVSELKRLWLAKIDRKLFWPLILITIQISTRTPFWFSIFSIKPHDSFYLMKRDIFICFRLINY